MSNSKRGVLANLLVFLTNACTTFLAVWIIFFRVGVFALKWPAKRLARGGTGNFFCSVMDEIERVPQECVFVPVSHRHLDPHLKMSATEIASRIRHRQTTASFVVEVFLSRLELTTRVTNALVATRFDEARREARRVDNLIRDTVDMRKLPPLLGVPITVKECFAVEGMPNTSGLCARTGFFQDRDSTVVRRLRDAGCIILGVTNTSELCMWYETSNHVYGRTRNPHDPNSHCGGSSGGEGAVLASCGSALGVGSDVGGSIRMPAFFNGIFGHKPTGGLVPNTGQFPNGAGTFLCTGPMSRFADDLFPALQIMAGPDNVDAVCKPMPPLVNPASIDMKNVVVLHAVGSWPKLCRRPNQDVIDALQRAQDCLRGAVKDIRGIRLRKLWHSFVVWSAMMSESGAPRFSQLMDSRFARAGLPGIEFLKLSMSRSHHTIAAVMLACVEELAPWTPRLRQSICSKASLLQEHIDSLLQEGSDGSQPVLLFPTFPTSAKPHRHSMLFPLDFSYCGVFNVLGLPSTQVPMGLGADGMPIGIQIVGRKGADSLCIAVAMELQKRCGGWTQPTMHWEVVSDTNTGHKR